MSFSFRTVMVFGFCGLLGGAVFLSIVIGLIGTIGNTMTLIARDADQMVGEAERRLINELNPIEHQARFLAQQFADGRLTFEDQTQVAMTVEASMAAIPDLAGAIILNPEGIGHRFLGSRRVAGQPAVLTADFSGDSMLMRAVVRAQKNPTPVWLMPVWVPQLRQAVINYHTPLFRDGRFIGLLIQGKAVADLSASLQTLADGDARVPFLIYDGDWVLAHPGLADLALNGSPEEPLPRLETFQDGVLQGIKHLRPAAAQSYLVNSKTQIGNYEFGDQRYLFAYRLLTGVAADKPVTVGIYQNVETYDSLTVRTIVTIAAAFGVLVVSAVIAVMMARATERPIRALAEASHMVRDGALEGLPEIPHSRMRELEEAGRAFKAMVEGLRERQRIRDLFGRVVPAKVAERMLTSPADLAPQEVEATVLFCDMVGFTALTEELGPENLVEMLNAYFTDMVDIVHDYSGIVTQFQGDAILAVFNVPIADADHADHALDAALTMQAHLKQRRYGDRLLKNRIGIATGPLIAANVGATSRMNYTVHGDTVNRASRLEFLNKELGTDILVDSKAASMIKRRELKALGSQPIRGQSQTVEVFTIQEKPVS